MGAQPFLSDARAPGWVFLSRGMLRVWRKLSEIGDSLPGGILHLNGNEGGESVRWSS